MIKKIVAQSTLFVDGTLFFLNIHILNQEFFIINLFTNKSKAHNF